MGLGLILPQPANLVQRDHSGLDLGRDGWQTLLRPQGKDHLQGAGTTPAGELMLSCRLRAQQQARAHIG